MKAPLRQHDVHWRYLAFALVATRSLLGRSHLSSVGVGGPVVWRRVVGCALSVGSALLMAAVFGVADLHLSGQGMALFWISNMSAFWLLLPFVAGCFQRRPLAATLMGLATTLVALTAFYYVGNASLAQVTSVYRVYFVGGVVTGPLYGWLGWRWRVSRSLVSGSALAVAFVLEPLAWRLHIGYLPNPGSVWITESLFGVTLTVLVAVLAVRRTAARRTASF